MCMWWLINTWANSAAWNNKVYALTHISVNVYTAINKWFSDLISVFIRITIISSVYLGKHLGFCLIQLEIGEIVLKVKR